MGKSLFCFLFLLAIGNLSFAQKGSPLVKNKHSQYKIVVPLKASAVEKKAAAVFRTYIHKMTGVYLSTVTDDTKTSSKEIRIGSTNRMTKSIRTGVASLSADGYWIQSDGTSLFLVGGKGKGVHYAVTSYLEDHLGCKKLSPEVDIIPVKKEIFLFPVSDKQEPAAAIRIINGELPNDTAYRDWRKLATVAEKWSEGDWRGYFVHTFDRLVPASLYFDKHPEYFSLINGKRIPYGQLCLTNKDVLDITIQKLQQEMTDHPGIYYWSVSQNDNFDHCRCDDCKKIDDEENSPMGSLLRFVNKVADAFPEKVITTLAYEYSRKPPVKTVPVKNVMITLCTIELNRAEPIISDPTSASFRDDMEGWSKICSNIMVWDYEVQFTNYLCPFPLFHTLQPNIQYFNKNGATSHFQQGNVNKGNEFAELKTYVISKLLWNPALPVEPIIHDFLAGYYGKAAPFIKEYFTLLHEEAKKAKQRLDIFGTPVGSAQGFLSAGAIEKYKILFNKAAAMVSNAPDYLHRVLVARLPIQFAEMEIAKSDLFGDRGWFLQRQEKFIVKPGMRQLLDSFYLTCTTAGIKTINESGLTPKAYYENTLRLLNVSIEGNLAFRKPVSCTPAPDKRYRLQGAAALTNGVKGTDDYKINWLGWEGMNAKVVVDLEKTSSINEAVISTLHAPKSWIIHPLAIYCSLSEDGSHYQDEQVLTTNPDPNKEPAIKNFLFNFSNKKARYIKFVIKASLTLPSWHAYSGNPSWLFVDEVVIK